MNHIVRNIPLDQVTPGMVVAEDVRQDGGNLLLPKNIELGAAHLTSLHKRGIKEIAIFAAPTAEESATAAVERQAKQETARLQVQHLFRKSETDETTQALIRTVLEYRLEKIQ